MKLISFYDWIDGQGSHQVAKALNVSIRIVQYWRKGHCFPRVDQMRLIKKLSRNQVTYASIIDGGVRREK